MSAWYLFTHAAALVTHHLHDITQHGHDCCVEQILGLHMHHKFVAPELQLERKPRLTKSDYSVHR